MTPVLHSGQHVLGRYLVQRQLGAGGMGAVFLALHVHLDTPVALKVVHRTNDSEARARFTQEAKLLARIRHPNVVQVTDFGFEGDTAILVMELLRGEDFDQRFLSSGVLPWTVTTRALSDAARGLQAVHENGIVHRDLKPANVMIDDRNQVRLVDFGIAKDLSTKGPTKTGYTLGTPDYMSPEQLLGMPLTPAADLFSFGVMSFELLSGQMPFHTPDLASLVRRAREAAPRVSAPNGLPSLPPTLVDLVSKLLHVDPARRPRGVAEVVAVLDGLGALEPTGAGARSLAHTMQAEPLADALPHDLGRSAGSSGMLLTDAVATAAVAEPERRALLAARIPPSRLADPHERRFLAEVGQRLGRPYSFGTGILLIVGDASPASVALARARACRDELLARYGATARVAVDTLDPSIPITPSMIAGARPLPEEVSRLLAGLTS
jgi:hypothetical protein